MKNLGQELTEDQLKLMIREADCNGDGVIDFEGKWQFIIYHFAYLIHMVLQLSVVCMVNYVTKKSKSKS